MRTGMGANPAKSRDVRKLTAPPWVQGLVAVLVLGISSILLFARLGHYPLWDDEAITALTSKSVWQTGDTGATFEHNVVAYRNGLLLRDMKDARRIHEKCVAIQTQENEADRIMQAALANLFANSHDPIEIIKWKDLYEEIESATDRCEDVANVLDQIVLKHA